MEILALSLLIILSLAGFAAIFFTTFGTLIIFIGSLVYALMTDFLSIGIKTLIVLFTLYLVGEVFEYVAIIIGGKKFGASNKAIIGALIGGILGAILGAAVLGVGLILGTFLGIFLGAFIVEYFMQQDLVKSLKAATGSVIGRVGSIAMKVVIGLVMLAILAYRIINYSGI